MDSCIGFGPIKARTCLDVMVVDDSNMSLITIFDYEVYGVLVHILMKRIRCVSFQERRSALLFC